MKDLELNQFIKRKKLSDEVLRTLSLVLESMAEGVIVSNEKGILLFTNEAFDAMLGYDHGELVGKHISDLTTYSAEENTQIYKEINQILDAQKVWSGEFSNKKKDGTVFYSEARISAVELRGKRCLISVQSDITQRKMMETSLKESETKYRIVSENTYDWGFWISPEKKFIYLSPSCKRITGYDADEFLADPNLINRIIHPEDQPLFDNHRAEAEKQLHSDEIEFRIIRKDGTVRWIGHVCQPVFDSDGNFLGTRASNRVLTKRKLAEDEIQKLNRELEQKVFELLEANKELDAFNQSVSHDLRTPLIAIGGFTNRLLKTSGNKLDDKEKDMINIIKVNTQKMERLIQDLLAFSHSGRQQIKAVEIEIEELVTTVLEELNPLTEGRRITFDVKSLAPAYGDISLIKHVLTNLLSNAIKYTRPRDIALIELSCKVGENENIYSVKDDGIGFDPQYADRLFLPFCRLSNTKEFDGTGIGLSIVERIINRHGGRVWAEGKVNEGATFYFSMPKNG